MALGEGEEAMEVGMVVVVVAATEPAWAWQQSRCSLKGESTGPLKKEHPAPAGVTAQAPSAH